MIPVESFLEKDHDKESQRVTLAPGMVIQEILTERDDEWTSLYGHEEALSKYHWIQSFKPVHIKFLMDGEATNYLMNLDLFK